MILEFYAAFRSPYLLSSAAEFSETIISSAGIGLAILSAGLPFLLALKLLRALRCSRAASEGLCYPLAAKPSVLIAVMLMRLDTADSITYGDLSLFLTPFSIRIPEPEKSPPMKD